MVKASKSHVWSLAAVFSLVVAGGAFGRTITVDDDGPADFNSIQAAIDDANDDDTIVVAPGTYYENIRISGKYNITLQGAGANVTTINGGGNGHVVVFNPGSGTISGFTITNSGNSPSYSAGVFTSQSAVTIADNIISNNSKGISVSSNSSATIAANRIIYNSGESIDISSSDAIIVGNLISNGSWAGIECFGSSPLIVANTITGHDYYGILGGSHTESWTICNNIIVNNKCGLSVQGGSSPTVGLVNLSYNNVWNNWFADYWMQWGVQCIPEDPWCVPTGGSGPFDPEPGTGEISEDPLFVNAAGGDYHLLPDSPCIDAGDNASVPGFLTTDAEGRPRISDGDCNGSSVVDMGAYEFSYAFAGDFDGECDIDFVDYAILLASWEKSSGQAGYNGNCDISVGADECIDWRDLDVFAAHWLWGVVE